MKLFHKSVRAFSACALGMWLAAPAAAQLDLGVSGQAGANVNPGRVVNGAGNAVQNATQGAQRAVQGVQQGAQQATQGARNLARESAQRTQQGVQNLRNQVQGQRGDQGNANLGANVGANLGSYSDSPVPEIPAQVRADANLNAQANRDARWRRMQHNGEWWYYSPQGNWMYHRDGQWNKYDEQAYQAPERNRRARANYGRTSNFRGEANADMRMRQDGRQVYRIRAAEDGSQFINLNGRRIFIESSADASLGGNQ